MWKIFTKAGEKGWKALIPIYDMYILFKIVWNKKAFWQFFVIALVMGICSGVVQSLPEESTGMLLASLVVLATSIALLVYYILLAIRLSHAFGHGAGFAVGLIFLEAIFIMILGFGESKYVGADNAQKPAEANQEVQDNQE